MADEGTVSFLVDKVSFVNKIPLLLKATSDDESPTPGYMYREISKISLDSGGHCLSLLDYLNNRLENRSYHVKLKCIRIMKWVVENGHPEFRQGLRRKSNGIQHSTKFSGPPDPLHGNAPYIMIRKEAKELSQMLFEVSSTDSSVPVREKSFSAGIGNTGPIGSGTKMEGFGNTANRPQKSLGESLISGIQDLVEKVSDPQPNHQMMLSPSHTSGDYKAVILENPEPVYDNHEQAKSKPITRPKRRAVKKHIPGVAGGGWDDEEVDQENTSKQQSSQSSNKSSDTTEKLEGGSGNDCQAETKLVNDIVLDTKDIFLSRKILDGFLKECGSLNCDKIIELVNTQLETSSHKNVQMHCMMLIEALLRSDLTTVDQVASQCAVNLIGIYLSQTGQCQQKARKIIRHMEKLCQNQELFKDMPPPVKTSSYQQPLIQIGDQNSQDGTGHIIVSSNGVAGLETSSEHHDQLSHVSDLSRETRLMDSNDQNKSAINDGNPNENNRGTREKIVENKSAFSFIKM